MGDPTRGDFHRIGVVGAGQMGSGIIEVMARSGLEVVAREVDRAAVDAGRERVSISTGRAVERGKLDADTRDRILAAVTWTTELGDLADCDLVVEAVVEDLGVKHAIFAELDTVVGPDAVLATNTSSIPVVDVAMATSRPERVVGMHFFNPAPVMKLVELIATQRTEPRVFDAVKAFTAEVLAKRVVVAPDRSGFVVNALLVPYITQAIAMYEAGHASREDIDEGMVLGCGHPMGPLTLADLIGLDTCLAVAESLYEEYRERFLAPPPLLKRMVAAGHLGRKTGRGFYDYT